MSISCGCDYDSDYDSDNTEWFYIVSDRPVSYNWKRSRRCCSCKIVLPSGTLAHCIKRWRTPITDIEDKIYGEGGEVTLADWYFCPSCYAIYEAFQKVDVCIILGEDLRNDLEEFNRDYAPKGFRLKVANIKYMEVE